MLGRDEILAAEDKKHADVNVPEWGGTVRVRTMSGKERQQFQKILPKGGETPDDFMEQLIVLCACNGDGKALFTREDVKTLSGKSAVALERVFKAAAELNGMTSEAVDAIKGE